MQVVAEILQHLVQRPEDYLENIEYIVRLYKDMILHALEVRTRYIAKNGNIDICVLSLNSSHTYSPPYIIFLVLLCLNLVECY